MARSPESSVRKVLNDADGYFYFVQRSSLHGETPARDFFHVRSVTITHDLSDTGDDDA